MKKLFIVESMSKGRTIQRILGDEYKVVASSGHVRDLPLPADVEADEDGDLTVFIVAEPAVVEEPVVAAAPEAPEVIKEKKPEAAAAGTEEKK